jgi:sulfur-oxidizing protein SoxZ
MADMQPRVQAPGTVAKGEIFQVRTIVSHPMETGLRHDPSGRLIPRKLINRFVCRYNGDIVFAAAMHEGMAADPYLAFNLRVAASGVLQFAWEEDGGAVFTLEKPLTVQG